MPDGCSSFSETSRHCLSGLLLTAVLPGRSARLVFDAQRHILTNTSMCFNSAGIFNLDLRHQFASQVPTGVKASIRTGLGETPDAFSSAELVGATIIVTIFIVAGTSMWMLCSCVIIVICINKKTSNKIILFDVQLKSTPMILLCKRFFEKVIHWGILWKLSRFSSSN